MLKQNEGSRSIQKTIGRFFAIIPISANQWTILSVIIALIAAYFISTNNLYAGLSLFGFSAFCDLIDGAVARARNQVSELGGFIDGVCDRFVEAIFLFSFMFYPLPFIVFDQRVWIGILIFIGTSMPSFIRAYADHKGIISREFALKLGGVFERSERLLLMMLGLFVGLAIGMEFFIYSIILSIFLSIITIFQRLFAIISYRKNL